jgi:hypothetical protein
VRVSAAGVALPLLGRDAGGPILRFSELFPTEASAATPPRRRRVRFARPGTGATCLAAQQKLLPVLWIFMLGLIAVRTVLAQLQQDVC